MSTTTRSSAAVSTRGGFYVTTVSGRLYVTTVARNLEFKTNLSLHGFWVEDRQVQGTAQRSFRSEAAFRRYAVRYYREHYVRD